ncbi:MAG: PEP-CTERM sorting domain-containing protein [Rubrivivax sp.]
MPASTNHLRRLHRIACGLGVSVAVALGTGGTVHAQDLSYLQSLLANTPAGGWVQANTTPFSSAWATEAQGGLPSGSYSDTGAVVRAWSAFAWDSNRAQLYLFGGGHASYMGNEMYVWSGQTGAWSRGSLPSRLTDAGNAVFYVVDDAAPQSAHTYDNQLFLPLADRFISFGGATFNTGGGWLTRDVSGNATSAGPWIWDPAKADPNKVGGTTGSGYLPTVLGGEMWQNRFPFTSGTRGGSALEGTTAYRQEGGKDVVYMTRDQNASGFPALYRYEIGNLATGTPDRWDIVGQSFAASSSQSTAVIDTTNNLYIQIGNRADTTDDFGIGVFNLANTNPTSPPGNTFVSLFRPDGQRFFTNRDMGLAYDEANNQILMWDGDNRGTVYYTSSILNQDGSVNTSWTVFEVTATTAAQPQGNFFNGVLGKWHYVAELDAFIAMDEFREGTSAAEIWLYKPIANPVPEPGALAMMLLGGAVVAWRVRRRRDTGPAALPA